LVLAFQTTLVALVAYLPLRKAADMQLQSLGRLEDAWLGWRRKEGK
jgi:energy-converting hydrogenase Eha subunit H